MPRRTHRAAPEEAQEDIRRRLNIYVPPEMLTFLEREAKRLGVPYPADVVRALITAYYEKRSLGLLIDPDD